MAGHADDAEVKGEVTPYNANHEDVPEQLQLFEDLVALERIRIQVAHDKNQIIQKAIQLADESDRRQFEYHIKQLEMSDERHK